MVSSRWRLLEDCGGLIEDIAAALPPQVLDGSRASNEMLNGLGNLAASFLPDMRLILLAEERSEATAQTWAAAAGIKARVEIVPVANGGLHPTAFWIQDGFHVRHRDRQSRFDLARSDNAGQHGQWLGDGLGIATGAFDFHLAGGNQLVGPDFRLVGYRSIELSARAVNDRQALCRAFGMIADIDPRPVHLFGFRASDFSEADHRIRGEGATPPPRRRSAPHQAGFHIDTVVSLTGKQQVGQPVILVADPVSPTHPGVAQVVNAKRQLDASAERLRRRGFVVLRNAVPYAVATHGKLMPRLYNNVLVENEIRFGRPRPLVWMPCFGDAEPLEDFDDRNAAIWCDLGFEVVRVSGWSPLAAINGALRCATKVLRRSPPAA